MCFQTDTFIKKVVDTVFSRLVNYIFDMSNQLLMAEESIIVKQCTELVVKLKEVVLLDS